MLLVREAPARDLGKVAEAMAEAWRSPSEESATLRMNRGQTAVEIDLATPQGRFELAVLAILCAAKVRESTAFETFNRLKAESLLELAGRWADVDSDAQPQATPDGRRVAIEQVLKEHYRALAHKGQKALAIITAAQRVTSEFQGDLARIGETGDWRETLRTLEGFPHIKSRAYWICRELRRHGVWPALDPKACSAIDSSVKLALWRTGFVGGDALFLRDIPARACLEAVSLYFDGDALPAFYQGERLCRRHDHTTCVQACTLRQFCRSPKATPRSARVQRTEQPFGCPQEAVDNVDNLMA